MAIVTYPGVYVEEVSSGVRPIAAASTSTAAFIGYAEKGDLNSAVKIYNFTEYQTLYGDFLNDSWLSHAVYQFFNNGGSQCYIVRVAVNTKTASITIKDNGTTAQATLQISAMSAGAWGNEIVIVIEDGTHDSSNEFNLTVYLEKQTAAVEKFENLSMISGTSNFVETIIAASKYIRANVITSNTNASKGTSLGAGTPTALVSTSRTKMRININGDGAQEIDLLQGAATTPADLSTAEKIATAITYCVTQKLSPLKASTDVTVFSAFVASVDASGKLLLTSGKAGSASSVTVSSPSDSSTDATAYLKLGKLNSGTEVLGAAVTRPIKNSLTNPKYYVGDNPSIAAVSAVVAGSDGDIPGDSDYVAAFSVLDDKDDVSLIAVPGIGSTAVVAAGMNYCSNRPLSDAFFIGDMALSDDTVAEATTFRNNLSVKNSYGAVYVPWVKSLDPSGKSKESICLPPSGFVAGLYAKTDSQRGVWKAPAGTAVSLGGSVGLAANFTDVQQGNLNPINVNVIRQFAGSGIVLWGARTITSDAEWNYIPVRRTAIMLRVSIYRGIQWAVFEPNDAELWAQLRLNIGSFMMTLYRQGAFQGSSPKDAFFVKCDNETTTQSDIDLGIVNVLVGFAALKPAEFIVVKISQKAGQSI